jgi:excinuclease ABC subunit B
LPSALDNRPLTYEEFDVRVGQRIYVSATPAVTEVDLASGVVVEQVIRPTGLVDPRVEVRPASQQVDDVIGEIRGTVGAGHRVLVTTLTKRMAEDLTDFLDEHGVRVRYLHSEVNTLERLEIVRELREGAFDVLVGINLLREGLDIPEVAMVAILDADKEGFLRSETSLVQTIGRAARNVSGRVLLYADKETQAVRSAIDETNRRRRIQKEFNQEHGVTPKTIEKSIREVREPGSDDLAVPTEAERHQLGDRTELVATLERLEHEMHAAAEALEFERAAELRDRIRDLKQWHLRLG